MRPRPVVSRRAEPGVNCGRNLDAGGMPLRGDAAGAGGRGRLGSGSGHALAQNDIRWVSGQMLGPMPRPMALATRRVIDAPHTGAVVSYSPVDGAAAARRLIGS